MAIRSATFADYWIGRCALSYPKNAATPPRIAVGAVVQISDGAVQTSGVSIRVVPQGGSAAAGIGTTSYEDGVVLYAPTQGEANHDAFVVIAYKTGCIPATTTIVTSDTATAGRVRLSGETHSGATIPTVTTITNAVTAGTVSDKTGYSLSASGLASVTSWSVSITGNITGNLSGSVGSVTGAVGSVASNGITAASLAADAGSEIAAAVRTELATELGRMDASVSSRSSHTASDVWQVGTRTLTAFSFSVTVGTIGNNVITAATLAADAGAEIASAVRSELATELARIDAATSTRSSHSAADVWAVATRTLTAFSFSVTVGTNNDKTGYSLVTAPLDASGTAAAVWDALLASYTTAGTFGGRVVRSTNSNNSVAITGANHVAADIHELQPAVIQATHFSLGAVDANALAADAASEIASAVRTNLATELGRIDAATSTRATPADIPSAVTIADAVLSRSVANVESSAAEHTLCTLVLAALEGAISGNTWTIRRSNGSTTHYVKTVTADANASPIVGVQ